MRVELLQLDYAFVAATLSLHGSIYTLVYRIKTHSNVSCRTTLLGLLEFTY
jgi:hypothetical protein